MIINSKTISSWWKIQLLSCGIKLIQYSQTKYSFLGKIALHMIFEGQNTIKFVQVLKKMLRKM